MDFADKVYKTVWQCKLVRLIREGAMMAKKRKPDIKLPEKTCWHLYSLQALNSEKFIKVVAKISRQESLLIK